MPDTKTKEVVVEYDVCLTLLSHTHVRALASKNAILLCFTISKSNFITYTIPFYNTSHIKKLYFY